MISPCESVARLEKMVRQECMRTAPAFLARHAPDRDQQAVLNHLQATLSRLAADVSALVEDPSHSRSDEQCQIVVRRLIEERGYLAEDGSCMNDREHKLYVQLCAQVICQALDRLHEDQDNHPRSEIPCPPIMFG